MSDEKIDQEKEDVVQTETVEEATNEPRYGDFFTAVYDDKGACFLELGPEQMRDFAYYLYMILRPRVTFDLESEKMHRQLLYRQNVFARYLLDEMQKALPDDHKLQNPIKKIGQEIDPKQKEQWATFRELMEMLKKEFGEI